MKKRTAKIKNAFFYVFCGMLITVPWIIYGQFRVPTDTGLPVAPISAIITNVMYWLLSILGVFIVIGFVLAGLLFLFSAGSEERAETARRMLVYSVLGTIVALIGLIVLQAVQNFLNARSNF